MSVSFGRRGSVGLPARLGVALVALGLMLGVAGPAHADYIYQPPAPSNNQKIYLSQACHDRADGVPGGACITNPGCDGYDENYYSGLMGLYATTLGGTGLLARHFPVRIGTGTVDQNVSNSDAWGAVLHVPLHSNAKSESCSSTYAAGHGTQVFYGNSSTCSTTIKNQVGASSPGTNDYIARRTDLIEVYRPVATSAYLEAEYHTWTTGTNWLKNSISWADRIAAGIDACR